MTPEGKEALDRLTKAIAGIGPLQKDKRNKHDGYDYLSEEAVMQVVSRACHEHGVTPSGIDYTVVESVSVARGRDGGQAHRVTLKCTLRWADGVYREGYGSGIDYGDKAYMKAQTSAKREAWKAALCIATGQDPEGDERTSQDDRAPAPAQQRVDAGAERQLRDAVKGQGARRPSRPPQSGGQRARQAVQRAQRASEARDRAPHDRKQAAPKWEYVPFGRNKGKHISEVDEKDLNYLLEAGFRALQDESKRQYWAMEQQRIDAINEELRRRESPQSDGHPFGDDDFPESYNETGGERDGDEGDPDDIDFGPDDQES